MSDPRESYLLSGPAYRGELGLMAPPIWVEAFGEVYAPSEDPEAPPTLIENPSIRQLVESLSYMKDQVIFRTEDKQGATADTADWCWMFIPWDRVREVPGYTTAELVTECKRQLALGFQAMGVNWWDRVKSDVQVREETKIAPLEVDGEL